MPENFMRSMARAPRHGQRGVATLLVVMVLFFVVSLVAAYASRNLLFEQRTSVNQYRATQSFEAAEAGVAWAMAQLNGGLVDASCLPTVNMAFDDFRSRYLAADPVAGTYTVKRWNDAGTLRALTAGCIRSGASWNCSCPSNGPPALGAPAGDGTFPAFIVTFEAGVAPGQLRIRSTGCTSANDNCLNTRRGTAGDAASTVISTVSLASAMPTSPAAPLTVRGNLNVGAFALHVANGDTATNGFTIHAGGTVTAPNAVLESVPGAPGGQSVVESDASLAGPGADHMFRSFLGVDRNTFKRQPTTLVLDCAAGCANALRDLVERNPGRPVWVDGDLTVENDVVIGRVDAPVMLVVQGTVDLSAGTRIVGVVYSQAANVLGAGGSTGTVQGAVLSEGNLSGPSAMAILFDAPVVNRVRLTMGPIIPVPGGWRDF